jgi:hypothetical protein
VRWREDTLAGITERLAVLGLTTCRFCDSGTLEAWRKPVVLPVGGLVWLDHPGVDLGSDIRFMVAMVCDLCGHTALFDGERLGYADEHGLEQE